MLEYDNIYTYKYNDKYILYMLSIIYTLIIGSGGIEDEGYTLGSLKKLTIHENCYKRRAERVYINTREGEVNFVRGLWKLCGEDRIGAEPPRRISPES